MTSRLYYTDSFLYDFQAQIAEVVPPKASEQRAAVILDKTAFYPTSGGQPYDTGTLQFAGKSPVEVIEVADDEHGNILHYVEATEEWLKPGSTVRGLINAERRRDHMQQHSGQHVLSAAFVCLFDLQTLSVHFGDESSTMDLDGRTITPAQMKDAARLANEIVMEDRAVAILFVDADEARNRGVRKIPDAGHDKLRLIEIQDFDLTACGGTHVRTTGQIGPILLRTAENVKQGVRVEFVCGQRALTTAQRDFDSLTEAAGVFSAHIWQVPDLARRLHEEAKAAAKAQQKLLEELADLHAREWVRNAPDVNGSRTITRVVADRDVAFTKMLAQKIAANGALALLANTVGPPTLIFAQRQAGRFNMGEIMKQVLAASGGRGGGSKDFAQGGLGPGSTPQQALELAERLLRLK
jgi:alanyl-tRNA synthetase